MKTIKISQNQYGNYRGFVSGKGWTFIGEHDFDAVSWVANALVENKGFTYAGDVWITADKVNQYIKTY